MQNVAMAISFNDTSNGSIYPQNILENVLNGEVPKEYEAPV